MRNPDLKEFRPDVVDTVVFDLDGTLLNTLTDLLNAVNHVLDAHGLPLRTIDQMRHDVGNGNVLTLARSLPDGTDQPGFEDMLEEFRSFYARHMNDTTRPYTGVLDAVRTLIAAGFKTAIVSNKYDPNVKALNEETFNGLFPVAMGEDEANGVRRKPEPDMVLAALDALRSDQARAVYVGDSNTDILTAINSGLPCISVAWGFRTREELEGYGADTIIDSPGELPAIFGL